MRLGSGGAVGCVRRSKGGYVSRSKGGYVRRSKGKGGYVRRSKGGLRSSRSQVLESLVLLLPPLFAVGQMVALKVHGGFEAVQAQMFSNKEGERLGVDKPAGSIVPVSFCQCGFGNPGRWFSDPVTNSLSQVGGSRTQMQDVQNVFNFFSKRENLKTQKTVKTLRRLE